MEDEDAAERIEIFKSKWILCTEKGYYSDIESNDSDLRKAD